MNGQEIKRIENIFKKEIQCINISIKELKEEIIKTDRDTLINTTHLEGLVKLPTKVARHGAQLAILISIVILLMGGLSTIAWYVAQTPK